MSLTILTSCHRRQTLGEVPERVLRCCTKAVEAKLRTKFSYCEHYAVRLLLIQGVDIPAIERSDPIESERSRIVRERTPKDHL